MNKDTTIILDLGHGGIDSEGVYTTSPNKMYTFPDGKVSYEGQFNREIGNLLGKELKKQGIKVKYTVKPCNASDPSLRSRVGFANAFNPRTTIFISLHSNASPSHKARGFEIFTSKGETKSDAIATFIGNAIKTQFPDIRFRADYSDGDIDKESQFYVLKNTKCPAVLLENLFFDNIYDYELLCSDTFQNELILSISKGIIRYLQNKP